MTRWIADQQAAGRRVASEVALQRSSARKRDGARIEAKLDSAAPAPIGATGEGIAMDFATELEGMFAEDSGNVVHKLISGIRSLDLRPVKPAQLLRKNVERRDVDAGQSAIEGIGDAGVQAIGACRNIVVVGESWLIQTVVSVARLVDPLRIGNIGPVNPKYLRPRVNRRQPHRLELAGIANRSVVISVKIAAADRVFVVEVIVHLADRIIRVHAVRQPDVDGRRAGRIRSQVGGKTRAVTADGRTKCATANLQAGGTDKSSVRLKIANCVDQAVRTVAGREAASRRRRCWQTDGGRRLNLPHVAYHITLAFVAAEEEQLILLDRSAHRATELFEIPGLLGLIVGIEKIARVERRIAAKRKTSAMQAIGAGFQADVYDCARLPSVFCRRIFN